MTPVEMRAARMERYSLKEISLFPIQMKWTVSGIVSVRLCELTRAAVPSKHCCSTKVGLKLYRVYCMA